MSSHPMLARKALSSWVRGTGFRPLRCAPPIGWSGWRSVDGCFRHHHRPVELNRLNRAFVAGVSRRVWLADIEEGQTTMCRTACCYDRGLRKTSSRSRSNSFISDEGRSARMPDAICSRISRVTMVARGSTHHRIQGPGKAERNRTETRVQENGGAIGPAFSFPGPCFTGSGFSAFVTGGDDVSVATNHRRSGAHGERLIDRQANTRGKIVVTERLG